MAHIIDQFRVKTAFYPVERVQASIFMSKRRHVMQWHAIEDSQEAQQRSAMRTDEDILLILMLLHQFL